MQNQTIYFRHYQTEKIDLLFVFYYIKVIAKALRDNKSFQAIDTKNLMYS
jgi:hypothetical protein